MTPKKKPNAVVLIAALIGMFAGWQVAKNFSAQYFPRIPGEINHAEIAASAICGGMGAAVAGGLVQVVGRMFSRPKKPPHAEHVE